MATAYTASGATQSVFVLRVVVSPAPTAYTAAGETQSVFTIGVLAADPASAPEPPTPPGEPVVIPKREFRGYGPTCSYSKWRP